MRGEYLNHDCEHYGFRAISDESIATTEWQKLQEEMERELTKEEEDEGQEFGHAYTTIETDKQYIYVVWLNELSRIYAGNEIMGVFDNEEEAKKDFHDCWEHQTERWGFDDEDIEEPKEEPKIDFSKCNYIGIWRCNDGVCDQTIGIIKLEIDKPEITVIV